MPAPQPERPRNLSPFSSMNKPLRFVTTGSAILAASAASLFADSTISRLTPPSLLFSAGVEGEPYVSRFLPGQRFDLQATVKPDAGQTITSASFAVDGKTIAGPVSLIACDVAGLPANTVAPTLRAFSTQSDGVHTLT